jgi:hypothetical protein
MRVWVVVVVSLSGAEKPPTVASVFREVVDAERHKRLLEDADETIAVTICESTVG